MIYSIIPTTLFSFSQEGAQAALKKAVAWIKVLVFDLNPCQIFCGKLSFICIFFLILIMTGHIFRDLGTRKFYLLLTDVSLLESPRSYYRYISVYQGGKILGRYLISIKFKVFHSHFCYTIANELEQHLKRLQLGSKSYCLIG